MRTFEELTDHEKVQAVTCWLTHTLEAVCAGGIRFDDEANCDDTQARIDVAAQEAEDMQTPWFIGEYILNDDVVRRVLLQVALSSAEEAIYVDEGQPSMNLYEVRQSSTPDYIQEFMKEAK